MNTSDDDEYTRQTQLVGQCNIIVQRKRKFRMPLHWSEDRHIITSTKCYTHFN